MAKKYVHRDGRVYRVFNTPFSDWNTPPDENLDFPNTILANDENDLRAQIGTDYVLVDRPKPLEAPAAPRLPLAALLGALAGMGIPHEKISQVAETRSKVENTDVRAELKQGIAKEQESVGRTYGGSNQILDKMSGAMELQDKMLQEFRVVVASNLPSDVQAIGQFILDVCPDLENEVQAIAKGQKRKKFSL